MANFLFVFEFILKALQEKGTYKAQGRKMELPPLFMNNDKYEKITSMAVRATSHKIIFFPVHQRVMQCTVGHV